MFTQLVVHSMIHLSIVMSF